jgi:hypothetical protein
MSRTAHPVHLSAEEHAALETWSRSRTLPHRQVLRAVIEATLHTKPPNAPHWSTRSMAKAQHLSETSIRRIWHAHNLKPHLVETFKLSRDKHFVEKLTDIVGLYLNPPDKALVLCVDEESQIQALEQTQPLLPLKCGVTARQTHDYARHGTTTLFAAITEYVENHNQNPKVFVWSATVTNILAKIAKYKEALDAPH